MTNLPGLRLLWFNLATDADDPILGFTTIWINALAAYCEYIDVLTMRMGRLAVANNVHVYSIGKEKDYSEPRRALEFYRILTGLLRKRSYDACFAHMMPLFAVMGAPLLKLRGIPITLWYAHGAVPLMLHLAEKLVDRAVTSAPEAFRLPSKKVIVIGQGIDTDLFVPPEVFHDEIRPFTIVSIGRIGPVKRLEHLLEAAHLMLDDPEMPPFRVRLVGNVYPQDGEYAESLQRMVIKYGLEEIVEFTGPVRFENVAQIYRQADVAVNLSRTGSPDKAALEAMSCGVLLVADHEIFLPVWDEFTDLLLVPEDSSQQLALRLKHLASLPITERQAVGQALRRVVQEHHSLSRLSRQLHDLLTSEV